MVKMCQILRLFILGISMVTVFSLSAEQKTYTVKRLPENPSLDGKIEQDPAWQGIPVGRQFARLGDDGRPSEQTTFRMGYRGPSMYVAVRCEEPQIDALKGEPDDTNNLWEDDCIEIFLSPPDTDTYDQFLVNAFGAIQKMRHPSKTIVPTVAEVAVNRGEDHWSLELKIPFSGVRRLPSSTESWTGNVARDRQPSPSFRATWAPVSSMHEPWNFASFQFEGSPDLEPGRLAEVRRKITGNYIADIDRTIDKKGERWERWEPSIYEAEVKPRIKEWERLKEQYGKTEDMTPEEIKRLLGEVRSFTDFEQGRDIMQNVLESADASRPRLFWPEGGVEEIKRRIQENPLFEQAYEEIERQATMMLDVGPVEHEKTGRRLLGMSRRCLKRVVYLSFVYRLTDDEKYCKRAQEEMLAAARFEDWNPSHFLDVAEMTAALAVGYDWLYPDLDPEARQLIRTAILEKGLRTSLSGGPWVQSTNNWGQVCHGGLALGALAVYREAPDLAASILARSIEQVRGPMDEYGPRGSYPEGPGYWGYGTGYNVLLIDALQSALGKDFELTEHTGFMASPWYYIHCIGATGQQFNYSDCGPDATLEPAMFWFASQLQKPELLFVEQDKLQDLVQEESSGRLVPLTLLWGENLADVSPPESLSWEGAGTTPVGMHRTGWDPDAVYVGVKGGSPGTNHAHMDIGSFVMEADGVRWAVDLGAQNYHSLEKLGIRLFNMAQESGRWDVFRLNNYSHNTLTVDGKLQRVNGHAPLIGFSEEDPRYSTVDMSSVYRGQLERAVRTVALLDDPDVVAVRDVVEAPDKAVTVRWGMVTRADVDIQENNQAVLSEDGERLTLTVHSPDGVKLETYETDPPPSDHDAANPGTRMLGFKVEVEPSERYELMVVLDPENGQKGEAPIEKMPDIPAP
ncbi:MAG: heparinase II/III domain-containing protein [Planctomycetota bacterium]